MHSYGKCLNNIAEPDSKTIPDDPRWPPIAQRRARKIKILSNYKFYLAFENAPIDDYVSEKVGAFLLFRVMMFVDGSGWSQSSCCHLESPCSEPHLFVVVSELVITNNVSSWACVH